MTSAKSGKSGVVTTASGATEFRNLTVDEEIDLLEATSMASAGHKEYIEGLDGVSGSATAIGAKPSKGADAALSIASGANTWSGAAIIHRVSSGIPVDAVITYDFDFTFTGVVTIS